MMPFEKYLQDTDYSPHENTHHGAASIADAYSTDSRTFSTRVQFQIPHFMHTGPPTLAHGGGAEALPVGIFNHTDSLAASWFANNNGFAPDAAYLSPSLRTCGPSEQYADGGTEQPPHPQTHFDTHQYDLMDSVTVSQPSSLQPSPQTIARDRNIYLDSRDQLSLTECNLMAIGEAAGLSAPSPLDLPVYSATGFDVLSILARVATRPNPRVVLGPVDLTCSFVVVDVRRYDHPIVYCSPGFCRLTGYSEAEVLGRNCRFLQSPDGQVQKGEQRRLTSPEAVTHLKKHLLADKECQTSIINYRKDGSAFINLVTVIPVGGGVSGLPHEESEVIYHVGFQVDLTEQPNVILQKLRDGSYMVNYSTQAGFSNVNNGLLLGGSALGTASGARKVQVSQPLISKGLKKMLADTEFVRSIPISNSTTVPLPVTTSSADKGDTVDSNQWLNLMLLESCPDFVHVVSLKGSFLYVAPSVRRVLGYEPEEMVGGSLTDFSHPEDVVPLMRELKESSSIGGSGSGASPLTQDGQQPAQISIAPRTVDLLFRARTKAGVYVWVECRGRLHVEPGKGRKAIVLSGRAREMPRLKWDTVYCAAGLRRRLERDGGQEFWSMLSGQGTFVVVGSAVREVLGWSIADLVGRPVGSVLSCDDTSRLEDEVRKMQMRGKTKTTTANNEGQSQVHGDDYVRIQSRLRRADGGSVDAMVVLYRPIRDAMLDASPMPAQSISPSPIICQIKLDDSLRIDGNNGVSVSTSPSATSLPSSSLSSSGALPPIASGGRPPPSLSSSSLSSSFPPDESNVFEELDTSRGSSWQYELQQLKFANQRLEDEVQSESGDVQQQQQQPQPQQSVYNTVPKPLAPSHAHPPAVPIPVIYAVEQTGSSSSGTFQQACQTLHHPMALSAPGA
ncbi:hypothetical protein AX15_004382, partial [Amanita polypyramis BW_CC]